MHRIPVLILSLLLLASAASAQPAPATRPAEDIGASVQLMIDRWKPGDPDIQVPPGTFEMRTPILVSGKVGMTITSRGRPEWHWRGDPAAAMVVVEGSKHCAIERIAIHSSAANPAHTGVRVRNRPDSIQSQLKLVNVLVSGTTRAGLKRGIDCDSTAVRSTMPDTPEAARGDFNCDLTDMTGVEVYHCDEAAYAFTGYNNLDNRLRDCVASYSGAAILSDKGSVHADGLRGGGCDVTILALNNGGYLRSINMDREHDGQLFVTPGQFIDPKWSMDYLVKLSGRVTRSDKSSTREWVRYKFNFGFTMEDMMGLYPADEAFVNINQPERQSVRNVANVTIRSTP